MITEKDVKHIAKLSKLEFTDEETIAFVKDMGAIVDYVNTLSKVDTSNLELSLNAISLNDLREDKVEPSLSQEDAILNAPKKRKGGFSVPQTF